MLKLTELFLEYLAKTFCGDILDCYLYIKGSTLVKFFNDNFDYHDNYENFPTRWRYVYNKLGSRLSLFCF